MKKKPELKAKTIHVLHSVSKYVVFYWCDLGRMNAYTPVRVDTGHGDKSDNKQIVNSVSFILIAGDIVTKQPYKSIYVPSINL